MLQGYKVLGAVLALGEATVPELSALSQVSEATVRTTLRRNGHYVDRIGTERTGRRGGQHSRWRLRPEARQLLRAQLRELERTGMGPWIGEREADSHELPAAIIAAEDVLLRLVPATTAKQERAELVKLAKAQLEVALASAPVIGNSGDRAIERHRRIVEILLKLEHAEQVNARLNPNDLWEELLHSGLIAEGDPLAAAIRDRLMQSPIGKPPPPSAKPPPPSAKPPSPSALSGRSKALFGHVGGPDPRIISEMRRLQQRVRDLEAELARLQEEKDVLAAEVGHELLVLGRSTERETEEVKPLSRHL